MTIHFNPYYSSSAYVSEKDCGLGLTFMGPYALLCEMELRSGYSQDAECGITRTIKYMQAMRKALDDNKGIFFAKSFQRDDLGTAELILRWRDSIRRYGWTGFADTSSEKLRGLAQVEQYFSEDGPADRWRTMIEIAGKKAIFSPADTINVTCAKEDLEPMLQELFDLLTSLGTTIKYREDSEVTVAPKLICFKDDTQIHEWLSRQTFTEHDVIVGASHGLLNDMLYALGKPLIGNTEEGIGPVMRIFTLGLSLFSNPVNIIDLLAYLQLPKNPLNALRVKVEQEGKEPYYRGLAHVLADILCRQGGISDDWKKNIDEAVYDYQGNRLEDKKIAELRSFIDMWENTDKNTGNVKKDVVAKYVSLLGKWANGNISRDDAEPDELDNQFRSLVSFCDTFNILIASQADVVSATKVAMWAGRIISPITLSGEYARKGCLNVVDNLGNIHSEPEHLVWVSAEVRTDSGYEYSFLSKLDIDELAKHGVKIPGRELALKADRDIFMNALSLCKNPVTIVTCERLGGELTTPNLVIAELTQKFDIKPDCNPVISPCSETRPVNTESPKHITIKIPPCNLDDYGKVQSASSIEKLINHPFDYYIKYILDLSGYGTDGIADELVMKGNIAHKYMQELGDDNGQDIAKMTADHKKSFSERFDGITRKCGILLLSEEKAIEYKNYKSQIRESIDTLLNLISDMKLTIVGQEQLFEVEMEPFGQLKGFIDCLLKDKNGDYVILDFKYGGKRYEKKVSEGTAIQLALYKKAVEIKYKAKVSFCGYYSFSHIALFSTDTPACPCKGYEPMEPIRDNDTFTQTCNSFIYRKKQLAQGILEEADGTPLNTLQYIVDEQTCNLLPLEYDADGVCKLYAYNNENLILKGDME